jgi:hypothetical protein
MHFDFSAGRVGGFGVHGSTGGATGAGFGLLYFESCAGATGWPNRGALLSKNIDRAVKSLCALFSDCV